VFNLAYALPIAVEKHVDNSRTTFVFSGQNLDKSSSVHMSFLATWTCPQVIPSSFHVLSTKLCALIQSVSERLYTVSTHPITIIKYIYIKETHK